MPISSTNLLLSGDFQLKKSTLERYGCAGFTKHLVATLLTLRFYGLHPKGIYILKLKSSGYYLGLPFSKALSAVRFICMNFWIVASELAIRKWYGIILRRVIVEALNQLVERLILQ